MPLPVYCPYCPDALFTPEHAAKCADLANETVRTLALDSGLVLGDEDETEATP